MGRRGADRNKSSEQIDAEFEAKKQREEAKRKAFVERNYTNSILKENGYRWQKYMADEEGKDFGYDQDRWVLWFDNDRVVSSVEQAMQELSFAGVTSAKNWLKDHNIEEQTPDIEVKRAEERAALDAEKAKMSDESRVYSETVRAKLVENGLSAEDAEREAVRLCRPHCGIDDHVTLKQIPQSSIRFVIDSDLRYGVLIRREWYSIPQALEMPALAAYRDTLTNYRRQNEERVANA